ncbi:methyltransferase domain-containing protein [Deinococcus sp. KSM4-11]|uniref:class I SAM-dependent methyltransferase n=1 Tax=Deinococcus sp. KSM4-11 TaxID=2568654 RepID=UPI0010A4C514|nr:class I SAM-dependent methyltransferase [Deinococcus sp. KSM4-11]THF84385.1 methyltransferase domain-containing protein [Deinococcus sp. KSM4-11]
MATDPSAPAPAPAPASVDLYNAAYGQYSADAQQAVRAATYGQDLGQTGWMTADELQHFSTLLKLTPTSQVLEVGSGSGGPALHLADTVGCTITGLDVNAFGVRTAQEQAAQRHLDDRAQFQVIDAGQALPFDPDSFDAVICNDAVCHIPGRAGLLAEWFRVLRPGGLMLFTDAMVITGVVSHEEIARRSSIGTYFYLPPGENERLIGEAGFELVGREDRTAAAAAISGRWHDARASHRDALLATEGEAQFAGLQAFLWCVHTLTAERRLSRYMYLARKPD